MSAHGCDFFLLEIGFVKGGGNIRKRLDEASGCHARTCLSGSMLAKPPGLAALARNLQHLLLGSVGEVAGIGVLSHGDCCGLACKGTWSQMLE